MMLLAEECHDCEKPDFGQFFNSCPINSGYFGDCFAIVWGLVADRSEVKKYQFKNFSFLSRGCSSSNP